MRLFPLLTVTGLLALTTLPALATARSEQEQKIHHYQGRLKDLEVDLRFIDAEKEHLRSSMKRLQEQQKELQKEKQKVMDQLNELDPTLIEDDFWIDPPMDSPYDKEKSRVQKDEQSKESLAKDTMEYIETMKKKEKMEEERRLQEKKEWQNETLVGVIITTIKKLIIIIGVVVVGAFVLVTYEERSGRPSRAQQRARQRSQSQQQSQQPSQQEQQETGSQEQTGASPSSDPSPDASQNPSTTEEKKEEVDPQEYTVDRFGIVHKKEKSSNEEAKKPTQDEKDEPLIEDVVDKQGESGLKDSLLEQEKEQKEQEGQQEQQQKQEHSESQKEEEQKQDAKVESPSQPPLYTKPAEPSTLTPTDDPPAFNNQEAMLQKLREERTNREQE